MFVQNVTAIHPIVVDIFQSGPEWWTDQLASRLKKIFYNVRHALKGSADTVKCTEQYQLFHGEILASLLLYMTLSVILCYSFLFILVCQSSPHFSFPSYSTPSSCLHSPFLSFHHSPHSLCSPSSSLSFCAFFFSGHRVLASSSLSLPLTLLLLLPMDGELHKRGEELYLCSVRHRHSSIFNQECICLKRALNMCVSE